MNDINDLLNKEKERLDRMEVPDNIEVRLKEALENIPVKNKKNIKIRVASFILIIILLGYNLDTLAFYSKKMIGYENVMNGSLRELNELGKGQVINKSYTFKDGVSINLEGIMLDGNNMVVFYTLHSPKGDVQDVYFNMHGIEIEGFGGKIFTYGGAGETNEDETRMNWMITTHEPPRFFEKSLKMKAIYEYGNKEAEYGQIPFQIDRSQAVGKSIRMNINKSLEIDKRNIKIKSLTASPTTTVIKGKIQNIFELGLDTINKNRIRPEDISFRLVADGKEIEYLGSGITTNSKGISFDVRFEALPASTKEIELKLLSFSGDFDADEEIELKLGDINDISVQGQDISIEDIYVKDGNTYITITTADITQLSKVYLEVDGKMIGLERTIPGDLTKQTSYERNNISYTRTLEFKNSEGNGIFHIKGIRYIKIYDELIYKSTLK